MRIHHGAHTRIERNPAKVLEPGHARNFKAAVERPRDAFSRFIDRERRAGIGSAIVLNTKARSATERPKHPEVLSVDRANPAFGFGTRPIEGRKPTTLQNAAGLRSEPPVSDPVATGTSPQARADCRAARRTAAGFRQVVRIARRTENLVKGLRSRAKLRGVGLANGDRSGATHAFDNQIVFG